MSNVDESAQIARLFAPLATLRGVGSRYAPLLARIANGPRIIDLLFTLPDSVIDRGVVEPLAEIQRRAHASAMATACVTIRAIEKPTHKRRPYRIVTSDSTGTLALIFFHAPFIQRLHIGDEIAVSGKIELSSGQPTMAHPDYLFTVNQRHLIPRLDPVWPLTAGLFHSVVRRAMAEALSCLPELDEWIPSHILETFSWPRFSTCLQTLHRPTQENAALWTQAAHLARERLAFDELFARQLYLCHVREMARRRQGRALIGNGELRLEATSRFGHKLTNAQTRCSLEIASDLAAPFPMRRLLQGDVGSGKTFVALLTMLQAVEAGYQAALMAPTEILARQHYDVISSLSPVTTAFLSGTIKGASRREVLEKLASGEARIAIGTHALFQSSVTFAKLGVAVIDEQHRFGVRQRLELSEKGEATDTLVMTATPIPRTLQLTQWGELAVSRLDEKPQGRAPITTTLHPLSALEEILDGLARALRQGSQIFWVCPLVEESETTDAAAAVDRWAFLRQRFSEGVGLAHGKQASKERQAALDDFSEGKTRILVATTVIEVGVDIPRASIMVIEHAERFGLAQLHQLRGRVGRGFKRSFCLLIYDEKSSQNARARLNLLRKTEDGFLIADADYRIRGGGEATGHRQSGLPGLRLCNNIDIEKILDVAHREASRVFLQDSAQIRREWASFSPLLRMFNRQEDVNIFQSG